MIAAAVGLGLLLVACGRAEEAPAAAMPLAVEATEPPANREGFLDALLPVPGGAVVVVYDVSGPAGLSGSLELIVAAGGHRRENWALTLPLADGKPGQLRGTTIQTPDRIWTEADGAAGQLQRVAVGGLADAYVGAAPDVRRAAFEGLLAWRRDLAIARREHPGETREILGETCLWQRVAAQTLCVWEATGIPLRYEGPAFTVEAVRIDREPELSDNAFALPTAAVGLEPSAAPGELDASRGLQQLAAGDYTGLALLLQPGFRPPTPG
jgi:hypothetical protein